jgi:hypothetical protein
MTQVETISAHSKSPEVDFEELVADIKSSLLDLNPTHDPRNLKAVVFACRPEIIKMRSEGASWPDINRIFEERGFTFNPNTIRIYCSKNDFSQSSRRIAANQKRKKSESRDPDSMREKEPPTTTEMAPRRGPVVATRSRPAN